MRLRWGVVPPTLGVNTNNQRYVTTKMMTMIETQKIDFPLHLLSVVDSADLYRGSRAPRIAICESTLSVHTSLL